MFWFHLVILVLLGAILGYEVWQRGNKRVLVPLMGILALFLFHCLYWGEACTTCDLNSVVCIAELALFWLFIGWGVWERYKGKEEH